jgi:hypothetical protein
MAAVDKEARITPANGTLQFLDIAAMFIPQSVFARLGVLARNATLKDRVSRKDPTTRKGAECTE